MQSDKEKETGTFQINGGTVEMVEIPKSERLARAGKAFGIFLGATIFAIFIPILHFILVPALFLATIFFTINSYVDDRRVGGGQVTCLKCHSVNTIPPGPDRFPILLECSKCGARLEVKI